MKKKAMNASVSSVFWPQSGVAASYGGVAYMHDIVRAILVGCLGEQRGGGGGRRKEEKCRLGKKVY